MFVDELKELKIDKNTEEIEGKLEIGGINMEESIETLREYKEAYNYLLEYWDSLDKEQHREINKYLNKIFILNKGEQVEDEDDEDEEE